MDSVRDSDLKTVEEYLAEENSSATRHEYLGGVVYAMSGGRNVHNQVATNISSSLWSRLRGGPCRAFNSDTKIRLRLPGHVRFYYPDVSVVCRQNSPDDTFQDEPVLVVEVLSASTKRTDEGEKREAYLTIPSLCLYLLVDPDLPQVVVFRRTDQGFAREVWSHKEAMIPLPELKVELPLADIYDGLDTPTT